MTACLNYAKPGITWHGKNCELRIANCEVTSAVISMNPAIPQFAIPQFAFRNSLRALSFSLLNLARTIHGLIHNRIASVDDGRGTRDRHVQLLGNVEINF
jgi:hypothetical protein